jgi:chromosome segregation ATPase
MHGLQQLFSSDIPIPLWQIIFYVALVSYFMFQRWFKLSFLASFILVLYWLHYAFRADLVAITSEAHLARAIYYVLGFVLMLLSIFALTFLEVDADSLLAKREKEITLLKAQAKNAEKTATVLQAELDKNQHQEAEVKKKPEKKLNAKIEKLEKRLGEAERLLETRDSEIAELQTNAAEAQKHASAIEALLDMYQNQESSAKKQLEDELTAKITALQSQLREREALFEQRDAELAALQARAYEAESNAATLKTQLQDTLAGESAGKQQEDLSGQIAQLKTELARTQILLEQRAGEVVELKAKATEAEQQAAALKAQLDSGQGQESLAKKKLEEKLNARISKLETQLKQGESLLEKRDAEVAELQAKTSEAAKHAAALKTQFEKESAQESAAKNKLGKELNARIAKLEDELQQTASLLKSRNGEIKEFESRALQAEGEASTLREQLDKEMAGLPAREQLQQDLKARIAKLEHELKEGETLLQDRSSEIAQLQIKAAEAEEKAATLQARWEKDQHSKSANGKLERELNAKIAVLEERLKQDETLLENRNSEIVALKAKASALEKDAAALGAELEKDKDRAAAVATGLEEQFNARVSDLENQLNESQRLLKERDGQVAELQAQAAQAEKSASALQAQLQKNPSQVSSAKKASEELNGKIAKLQAQVKQGETLLKARNSEIAALQAKASAAEKSTAALKAQLEKETIQVSSTSKKLEAELHAKIAQLETQLQESQSALEKRNSEIAGSKAPGAEAIKAASAGKAGSAASRPSLQARTSDDKTAPEEDVRRKLHQFQYAVKYLEDEIKEKDRLLGLMAKKHSQAQSSTKNAVDEDFKKKIHQLEQAVKYLENQSKEKDGLLGLMAKRNQELADLKSKAEEKLEALEASLQGEQGQKGGATDIASER